MFCFVILQIEGKPLPAKRLGNLLYCSVWNQPNQKYLQSMPVFQYLNLFKLYLDEGVYCFLFILPSENVKAVKFLLLVSCCNGCLNIYFDTIFEVSKWSFYFFSLKEYHKAKFQPHLQDNVIIKLLLKFCSYTYAQQKCICVFTQTCSRVFSNSAICNGQNNLKTTQMDKYWYTNTMEHNLVLRIKNRPLCATT